MPLKFIKSVSVEIPRSISGPWSGLSLCFLPHTLSGKTFFLLHNLICFSLLLSPYLCWRSDVACLCALAVDRLAACSDCQELWKGTTDKRFFKCIKSRSLNFLLFTENRLEKESPFLFPLILVDSFNAI